MKFILHQFSVMNNKNGIIGVEADDDGGAGAEASLHTAMGGAARRDSHVRSPLPLHGRSEVRQRVVCGVVPPPGLCRSGFRVLVAEPP